MTLQCLRTVDGQTVRDETARYEVRHELPEPKLGTRDTIARVRNPIQRNRLRNRCLAHGRFDLCHLHSINYLTGWFDLRGLGRKAPLVSTVHDVRPHRHQLPAWTEDRLLRELYRRAGHLIVFHEVLRDELVADFGVDSECVSVLPHPLQVRFDSNESDGVSEGGTPRVLFFGGMLRPNKGVSVLVEALQMLQHVDARFFLTGSGEGHFVTELESARSRDVVVETGHITEPRKEALFRAADVVVMPYTETHSQSGILADAYSFGVPLIVTDVGAVGPTVRDDGSGWVVESGSARALAEAIEYAVEDSDARKLARRNVRTAAMAHSYPVVGARVRRLYDELVASAAD